MLDSRENIAPLFPMKILSSRPLRFDFSRNNPAIRTVDMSQPEQLEAHITEALRRSGRSWGYGGWGEDRFLYQSSPLFKSGQEYRSIHLGIDIWLPPGTPIYTPMTGKVHSFADNQHFLDYGPTIITEHEIGGVRFYILYGHLSRSSLARLKLGQTLRYGDNIATIGERSENGSWPPHVHLQLIADMGEKKGDYPGVAKPSEKARYLQLCPNPESLIAPFLVA